MLYSKGGTFIIPWKEPPMDPLQLELNQMVDAGLPGAFVYIEDANGTSQFYTAGVADLATRQRMTPESYYRVGSTTKTFTAVVLLQLVAQGKLALGDTLHTWLPDLRVPNAESLTIEHLLRMRSGLCDFEDDPSLLGSLEAHLMPWSLSDAVFLGIKHPTLFPPGAKFSYCNTNFCLLEMIIERLTGHSLAEELMQRIFAPLDLQMSSYPAEDDLSLPEPYIRGYEQTTDGWRECSHIFFGRGDGALISTAVDLARFFRALLVERTLLPPALLKQMMYILPDEPPAEEAYGLDLIADPLPCGTVWGHAGGGFGYGDLPYLHLESGRFAVCMLNGTAGFRVATDAGTRGLPRFSEDMRALAYRGGTQTS
jgi:D-alanyl-D-alanine carboxypeptidase